MVTAEEVKLSVLAKDITWIPHHRCGVCDAPVGYIVSHGEIYYDSSCDCAQSHPRPSSWDDLASWINLHTGEWYDHLLKLVGLVPRI